MTVDTLQPPEQGRIAAGVADLRCLYRRHGLRELMRKITGRLRSAVLSREEVVVLVKDLRVITDMTFSGSLRIEELEPSRLPALYEFNRRRCDSKANGRVLADVERGYRGYVGYVGDQLVGYYWWVDRAIEPNHRDIAHYGLDIELGEGEVYGFDFFLLEDHRGGGNAVEFLYNVETRLRELGYHTLWGYVMGDNKRARWLYSMRGYGPVRKATARRVLTRRVPIATEPQAVEARARPPQAPVAPG